jgi:hypothetical protein
MIGAHFAIAARHGSKHFPRTVGVLFIIMFLSIVWHGSWLAQKTYLRSIGDRCVTFNSWLFIHQHWKPRREYGIDWCSPKDYPAGVKDGQVGLL